MLYASPDLQACIHELRVTAEDDLYVATFAPVSTLRLLDLAALLTHEDAATEFDSLDMAAHMLFLAGMHFYSIARRIALAAHAAVLTGLCTPHTSACSDCASCPSKRFTGSLVAAFQSFNNASRKRWPRTSRSSADPLSNQGLWSGVSTS